MFKIDVDAREAQATLKAIGKIDTPLRRAILKVLRPTAQEIKRDAQASAKRKSGGGKVYRQAAKRFAGSKKSRITGGVAVAFHRASAPGEPPVMFSGTLASRFRAGVSRTQLAAVIVAASPHAHLLEFGTRSRTRKSGGSTGSMAPRPFIGPQLDRRREAFGEKVAQAVEEAWDARA